MENPAESEPAVSPAPIPVARKSEPRTLVFVSVGCRAAQADAESLAMVQRHATLVRETLGKFKGGEEIGRFGKSFFIQFTEPAVAVRFCLQVQANMRALAEELHQPIFDQFSIDVVDVPLDEEGRPGEIGDAYEKHAPICRALAATTTGNQILLTRPIFDEVRLALMKEDLKPFGSFSWFSHGPCLGPGIETPVEVGEIREGPDTADKPPAGLERAPARSPEEELPVWGWRPGPGASIPGTRFVLDGKSADGRFGEEWSGGEPSVKERRLFKFCMRTDWASQLKAQQAVFESVKKKVGQNPNVLVIQGVSFDQPPYYIMTELFEGKDLLAWAHDRGGGAPAIPFPTRLELIAQAAAGLAGAHEGRILHRCMRPENILVAGTGMTPKDIQVKLAHFGVGEVALDPREEADSPPHDAHPVPEGETPPPSIEDMYKAPEVIAGQEPTAKSEVYSLGVVMCQLILGNLSEPLTPKRMAEIVGTLKRDGLMNVFAAEPQARAEGTGRMVSELRNAIKDREARVTWQGQKSRRQMIERIVMISMSVIAAVAIAILGPKYLRRRREEQQLEKAKKKPEGRKKDGDEESDAAKLGSDESREKSKPDDDESSGGQTTSRRPASAVRDKKKKEEVKESAGSFFRLIVLPIGLVIILGTIAQQFGPRIKKYFQKEPPLPPPET